VDGPDVVKQELANISAALSKALQTSTPEEWRKLLDKAIRQIDDVIERLGK
jgi:hypothetical protein